MQLGNLPEHPGRRSSLLPVEADRLSEQLSLAATMKRNAWLKVLRERVRALD
ncbi:MAG: hypothetical protein AB1758_16965 [Candidatus Eremiobacterota bacterium]